MSGIISADGLGEMIDGAVDCARLAASPVRCYATCLRVPRLRPDRFLLNGRSSEDVRAILLASAAIPFFFPMAVVEGRRYLDGGLPPWGDNVPVQPLYAAGGLPHHPGGPPVRRRACGCRQLSRRPSGGAVPQRGPGRSGGHLRLHRQGCPVADGAGLPGRRGAAGPPLFFSLLILTKL